MHPALVIAAGCQEVLQEICKMSSLFNRQESWKNGVKFQRVLYFFFFSPEGVWDHLDKMCEA